MNPRVIVREFVQCVRGGRVTRACKDDGVGISLEKGKDQVVADTSVGTGNCGQGVRGVSLGAEGNDLPRM
jgi:hypothetical protein